MKNLSKLYCLMLVASLVSVTFTSYAQDGDAPVEKYGAFIQSPVDCSIFTDNTKPLPLMLYKPYMTAILIENGVISYRKEQQTSYTAYQGKVSNKTNKAVIIKPNVLLLQKTVSAG